MVISRTVVVSPRSINDCPIAINEEDLICAFGNVLAWADSEKVKVVSFDPAIDPSFSFVHADGSVSSNCENVSEPPDDLKHVLFRAILMGISRNRLAFCFSKFMITFLSGACRARLLVLVAEGDSVWDIEVNSFRIVSKNMKLQSGSKA